MVDVPLDRSFTAVLQRSPAKGGWTFVVTDWSAAFFGTRHPRAGHEVRAREPSGHGCRQAVTRTRRGAEDRAVDVRWRSPMASANTTAACGAGGT